MTVLSSAVTALLCTIFSAVTLAGARADAVQDQKDHILLANQRAARSIVQNELPPVLPSRGIFQVIAPDGRVAAASPRMAGQPRLASFTPPGDSAKSDRVVCQAPGFHDTCLMVVALQIRVDGETWIIYGAQPVIPWYVDYRLLVILEAGAALLVAATAIAAYRTVSKTLRPVEAIRAELAEITSAGLDRRVPVPKHHDEIRELAETVNRTLDRLEAAVEQQRSLAEQQRSLAEQQRSLAEQQQRFVSDASHDLRSPITAARTQLEEALLHPAETDWPATAQASLASLDRLQAIVTDLLTLARLDAGTVFAADRVSLSELVESELTRRAPRVRIVTNLQPGVVVVGDGLQLGRLLTNLMDNAERHAASSVTVSVRRERDDAVLEVHDDGPGISPEEREFVFRRFARLDAARNKDAGGTGLGLAIAREIAGRHGGTLTIESSDRGARFVLRIPAA
ncbi:HAMP domain-containing histidine kinase [Nonomuraea zeae]|uniref:histidine kinase n=2 Tax=Nonomuraea zeae TaxID=1642303 RepID=A0A5S4FQ11_9ACTN|nr:HAMP domain-containing histidine kinase [Nonomuraea zeae]